MKKNIRYLIIMLAVLVVIGGGAAALLLTQPEPEETSSSSTASVDAISLISRESEEVSTFSVTNTEGSFVIIPVDNSTTSQEEDDSSSSSTSLRFTVDGYQGFDVDTASVTAAVNTTVLLSASKELGEQDNLDQFGLSGQGVAQVTIQYTDGTSDQFTVGNEAGESVGRYLLVGGKVYVGSFSEVLLGTPLDFINTEIYSVPDRTEETVDSEGSSSTTTLSDVIYTMTLSGSHLEQPITIESDTSKVSGYMVTSPMRAESGTNTLTEIVTALKSLTADSVAATGRTQENLEKYGLSEPYAQVQFDMNGEEHTLAVSDVNSDGNRYLIADDLDVIFVVANDTVTSWADATLLDLRMSYVWLPNINDVSSMTITMNGKDYRFDVEKVLNEEKSTEDEPSYDLVVTNGDGESVEYEIYQDLYQLLLSQAVLSVDTVTYDESAPVMSVTYQYFDGSDPDEIVYCPVEGQDERYAALLNGQYSGMVRRTELQSVLEKVEPVYQNQPIEED
ncbi:MAG: DUF4340 domain-containing protein [Acutalibacter sp.]|jgi:hypothetical protein